MPAFVCLVRVLSVVERLIERFVDFLGLYGGDAEVAVGGRLLVFESHLFA